MIDLTTMTVRDIALTAPATTRVFEEYKIDFCCGGRKSLSDACIEAGAKTAEVSAKLEDLLGTRAETDNPESFGVGELIDHIIDKHHEFTRSEMLRLNNLAEKVAWKHGENHPELNELKGNFLMLTNDLIGHMRKEEMVFFLLFVIWREQRNVRQCLWRRPLDQ
jgi:regulator of cell morphogenesis and NO signaling